MRRLTLRFTPEQMARLKAMAEREERSVSAILRDLIDAVPEPSEAGAAPTGG